MATIQYSAVINEIKGSINGTTFQGHRGGKTVKSKPNPVASGLDGKLTKADAGRVWTPQRIIAQLSTEWKGLTDAQRLTWSIAAPGFPFKNKFGETYTASGYQVYMSLNLELVLTGGAKLSNAPLPQVVPNAPAFHLNPAAVPALQVILDSAFPPATKQVLYASGPVSAGLSFIKFKFKAIRVLVTTDVFPLIVTDDYIDVFGNVPTGALLYFKMDSISTVSGQKGVSYTTSLLT